MEKNAKHQAKQAALLHYIAHHEEDDPVADPNSEQGSDITHDDPNDEEESIIAATFSHVSKKFKTELVDKEEIVRDVVLVSESIAIPSFRFHSSAETLVGNVHFNCSDEHVATKCSSELFIQTCCNELFI